CIRCRELHPASFRRGIQGIDTSWLDSDREQLQIFQRVFQMKRVFDTPSPRGVRPLPSWVVERPCPKSTSRPEYFIGTPVMAGTTRHRRPAVRRDGKHARATARTAAPSESLVSAPLRQR